MGEREPQLVYAALGRRGPKQIAQAVKETARQNGRSRSESKRLGRETTVYLAKLTAEAAKEGKLTKREKAARNLYFGLQGCFYLLAGTFIVGMACFSDSELMIAAQDLIREGMGLVDLERGGSAETLKDVSFLVSLALAGTVFWDLALGISVRADIRKHEAVGRILADRIEDVNRFLGENDLALFFTIGTVPQDSRRVRPVVLPRAGNYYRDNQ